MPVVIQTISTPEIAPTGHLPAQTKLRNSESIAAERLSDGLFASAFNADLNLRTRFDNQQFFSNPSLLNARIKDSVYRELTDSLTETKKQPSIALTVSQSAHSLALQSFAKEFQFDSAIDPEESELLFGKYFRKQDKLAEKAVDEFHADLVGAIE